MWKEHLTFIYTILNIVVRSGAGTLPLVHLITDDNKPGNPGIVFIV